MIIKTFWKIALVSFLLISFSEINAQNDTVCKQIASNSVLWMQDGNEEKLIELFTKDVASKLDLETTKTIWPQLIAQLGEFESIDTTISGVSNDNYIVNSILKFKKGKLNYSLTFNEENKIAGIFFRPYKSKKEEFEAEETDVFKEKAVNFVSEKINFPAMLCLPKHGLKAMVVFVHGSGPNDMDETIGPNKIFKQIAHELAKYGIGSLRYHKRSYLVQQGVVEMDFPIDLQHVVVSDASAAVDYLTSMDSMLDIPIFVVGHSLGAYAAPLIATQNTNVDGIVILAGNSRPLEDLIVEQYAYLYARGGLSKAEKADIKKIKKQAKNVKSLQKDLSKGKIKELPLINDTNFWLSLNAYNPVETANQLNIPILNIRGERDYQVPFEDFRNWKFNTSKVSNTYHQESVSDKQIEFTKKSVTFVSYSGLNHLFIYGKEKSYPEEYNKKGNVSKLMISDMANWINLYSK
jgi:dienelactone hydrolase